jgi:hypothetical protein
MEIKRKHHSLIWILLISALGLYSCQKANPNITILSLPVVEAYLVPGTVTQVKVYYQKYLDDTLTYGYPVEKLAVNISDGSKSILLTETAPGTYLWNDTSFVKQGKTYSLQFSYNGTTVSAQTIVPEKPTGLKVSDTVQYVAAILGGGFGGGGGVNQNFDPVIFSWDNPTGWYYTMKFKNISQYPSPVNSNNTNAYHDFEISMGQNSTYKTTAITFPFIGNYQVILLHVTKEYIDATTVSGGSSLSLTNPSTNITNGLGVFTAMQADTVNLNVRFN